MKGSLYTLLALGISLAFIQCSSPVERAEAFKSLGSKANKSIVSERMLFSPENYKMEAIDILERGKRRIKDTLPLMIKRQLQLHIFQLEEFSKQPLLTFTLAETKEKQKEILMEMNSELIDNELAINKIYYEIGNELTLLNYRYINYFNRQNQLFQPTDYYEVSPFVFGPDIEKKFDELYSEVRTNKRANQTADITIEAATYIPALSYLKAVKPALLAARTSKASMTSNFLSLGVLQSETKGLIAAARQKMQDKMSLEGLSEGSISLTNREIRSSLDKFQIIKSQVDKRIGDFSDGIISQPIGNLRKIIEKNMEEVANVGKIPEEELKNL